MYNYLTVISTACIAVLLVVGTINADMPEEKALIARGGGAAGHRPGGGHPGGGAHPHPAARNQALQRTPTLSRANLNNHYGAYGAGAYGAAAGYAAGAAGAGAAASADYAYPSTTYYYSYPTN